LIAAKPVYRPAVFADHHEVDVFRAFVLDGRFHAGIELHGAQVDVLVQFKAHAQQDALFEDARQHFRTGAIARQQTDIVFCHCVVSWLCLGLG
jgi:hypothetical protein